MPVSPTHNPNNHPEDETITSMCGVLNTPPQKGIVGEITVRERAVVGFAIAFDVDAI